MVSQEDFEKMAPKAPRKANPEVPPPPPSIEDLEIPQLALLQVFQTSRDKILSIEKYYICYVFNSFQAQVQRRRNTDHRRRIVGAINYVQKKGEGIPRLVSSPL